jgi:hypothetical protein
MFRNFRIAFTAFILGIFLFSCVKKESRKDVEQNLKTAMGLFLNHKPGMDTTRVKFRVLEVVYFEDKLVYICDFKVNMKEKQGDQIKDTTGMMQATVSKDYKTVTRKS